MGNLMGGPMGSLGATWVPGLRGAANSLGPPTCLKPPPITTTVHVHTHAHMRPRSNALATEASLPYTGASDGCPDGQLITGPTTEFPEVGSEPGAQPAPTGGLGAGGARRPASLHPRLSAGTAVCCTGGRGARGGQGGRGDGGPGDGGAGGPGDY